MKLMDLIEYKRRQKEAERRDRAERAVIRHGVSKEALEVLKQRYGFNLPVYGNDVFSNETSNDTCLRRSLVKDGQREVLCFLESCLTTSNDNDE